MNSAGPQKAIRQDNGKVFRTMMLVTPFGLDGAVVGALVAAGFAVG